MYYAPYLISTGSTMSLLPGLARADALASPRALITGGSRSFASPLLFDEESVAINSRSAGRRVGCASCAAWMLQRDHALCQCEVKSYEQVPKVVGLLRQPGASKSSVVALPPSQRLCPHCDAIRCAKFRPIACEIAEAALWRSSDQEAVVEEAAESAANAAPPVSVQEAVAPHFRERAAPFEGGGDARLSSCAAAGASRMSQRACRAAASRRGFGRAWIGASHNAAEAAGCVLWEDGNVEFNTFSPKEGSPQSMCNVRGTCLCEGAGGAEVQVVGRSVGPPSYTS